MKTTETQVREALLHSAYGKFDLVVDLIPQDLLLAGKPRRVKEWLIKNLEIKEDEINSNTLRSWLYRFRKSQQPKVIQAGMQQWQEFEPSVIKTDMANEKLIIKKVSNPKSVAYENLLL